MLSIEPAPKPNIKWLGYPRRQALYDKDITINPLNGKPQRGIYLESKMTTKGMFDMLEMPVLMPSLENIMLSG